MDIANITDLINQFKKITDSRLYKANLNNPKYNWLDKDIDDVIIKVQDYLTSIELISV